MDQKSYVLLMEESQCLLNIIHDKIQPASQPHATDEYKPRACKGFLGGFLFSLVGVFLFFIFFFVLELYACSQYKYVIERLLA